MNSAGSFSQSEKPSEGADHNEGFREAFYSGYSDGKAGRFDRSQSENSSYRSGHLVGRNEKKITAKTRGRSLVARKISVKISAVKKTGSEIVFESLIAEGVDTIFGYPGGQVLPLYHALTNYAKKINHILTRHEQGAAFAAEGYARASGKVGVCMATSGPGATNLITGIANAFLDSIPLVAITGQVPSDLVGSDAFQEADMTGITLPITKHNYLVTRAKDLAQTIREAFHLAKSGRPGPVHIDITKDAQVGLADFNYKKTKVKLPGYLERGPASASQIKKASELIAAAKKPVIISGHGVLISGASKEIQQFVERIDAPVVATLLGISSIPFGHKNYLGMLGMHGSPEANFAISHADLIISVGARFDDRITGRLSEFSARAKVIHIDIDSAEIGKIIKPDAPIVADARDALKKLNAKVAAKKHTDWFARIVEYSQMIDAKLLEIEKKKSPKRLKAVEVVHAINKAAPNAFIVSDVGQNQMWAAMHFQFRQPGRLLSSGGLGSMGYGLPAALGATVAQPQTPVWCLTGDGGIQMNIQELTTLAQEKIPLKIAVFNNGFLGMVRQWQELFYDKNYSATPLLNPDFVKLAEACGIKAFRVTKVADALKITKKAAAIKGPVLVEYLVEPEENVFPMVAPGDALKNTRIK
ncbi:MAG: biosynthetic-type acetolactate synthase large subunit [Candidatus Peribacteraceae bacterium]|nr:biosynthetic-type acetolactate synthase large subunit [Candidatus Peribacteraceae bacterium]